MVLCYRWCPHDTETSLQSGFHNPELVGVRGLGPMPSEGPPPPHTWNLDIQAPACEAAVLVLGPLSWWHFLIAASQTKARCVMCGVYWFLITCRTLQFSKPAISLTLHMALLCTYYSPSRRPRASCRWKRTRGGKVLPKVTARVTPGEVASPCQHFVNFLIHKDSTTST